MTEADIQATPLLTLELQDFPEENIRGALLPQSRHLSAALGVVAPRAVQTKHHQRRPDDGIEVMIVLSGSFELLGAEGVVLAHDCAASGPVYIEVASETVAHLKNTGDVPVHFVGLFAPPFSPGEIVFDA